MLKYVKLAGGVLILAICCLATINYAAEAIGTTIPYISDIIQFGLPGDSGMVLVTAAIAPFAVDRESTGIAIAYRNPEFVADRVLPRKPVGKQAFKHRSVPKGTYLTIPNTLVGRTGKPNTVEMGWTETPSVTTDYALDAPVPNADVENAPADYNPRAAATEMLADLIELDREKRVADLVFALPTYGAGNRTTLEGTSQFSHASSTPIKTIMTALDACFRRPNKCVMGQAVWTQLSQHADIVSATQKNSGEKGRASRAAFAELFELQETIVGTGWYNSAKPGQAAVTTRLWGKSILFFYQNPVASVEYGLTFGLTAQWLTRQAGPIIDPDVGARGGTRQRVLESVAEVILCADCAYLFDAAVA